jgi:hypothetical protein
LQRDLRAEPSLEIVPRCDLVVERAASIDGSRRGTGVDWLYAGYIAASNELVTYPMGGNWYIINYYAPILGVTTS